MTRFVFAAVLLAAAPVRAQRAPDRAPTLGDRVLLVVGAAGGGVLAAHVVGPFAPVGVGIGTYATSAALGFEPTVGRVALETALGTGVGAAVAVAVYLGATELGDVPDSLGLAIGAGGAGLVAAGVVTGVLHGRRLSARAVEAGPVAFRVPTGEAGVGLGLRVGL